MGHDRGIITQPFDNFDIAAVLGEPPWDEGTLCVSPNINPRSRYKPYNFGTYNTLLIDKNGVENPILKANNFGMTPSTIGWNPYRALPWGQYTPPKAGEDWLRKKDFDHYSHYAAGGISTARIYTNNPRDDRKIMLGGDAEGQEGKIIGEVIYSFDPQFEILPEDFTHPSITGLSLADFRFTLLFGPIQNNNSAFSEAPWVSQSSISIKEMLHSEGGTNYEKLEIILDRDISNQLKTWTTDSDDFLAILCLAPPIVKNANGRFSRWQIGSNQSNNLEFNRMGLVSLDMWEDTKVQEESVLFTVHGYWDMFAASAIYDEVIGVAANKYYLENEDEDFDDSFTVQMLNGYVNVRTLYLDSTPFSNIWFETHSKIRKLRPGISYQLFNSSGVLVYSGEVYGEEVVSSGGDGMHPYSIDFGNTDVRAEVNLPSTISSGTYRLRLRAFAEQTEFPYRYVNGKAYRQIMEHVDWTTDWQAEGEGRVQTSYKDINVIV